MTECGIALRSQGANAKSMEETADKIVNFMYNNFCDEKTGEKEIALVRLFKTHAFDQLEAGQRQFAKNKLGREPSSQSIKCLTLLATAGLSKEWNSRKTSGGHIAIPLESKEMVLSFPMISNLVKQFGLEIENILEPDSKILLDMEQKTYNIFFIEDALGSQYIPAQEQFVIPFKIKSVFGLGGILPSGNMFAVILFTRVKMPGDVAEMFKTLALNIKMSLLPFEGNVFVKDLGQ
jgi:hypothetical protein